MMNSFGALIISSLLATTAGVAYLATDLRRDLSPVSDTVSTAGKEITTKTAEAETVPESSPPPKRDLIINLPRPFVVYPGGRAYLVAGAPSGAECDIVVRYYSGPSTAQGLYPKTADSAGQVRWDWNIGTNTTAGRWPVDVHCALGEQTGSGRTYIDVQ